VTLFRRVLVTGSRDWTDEAPIRASLESQLAEWGGISVIHGACRGADEIAGQWARDCIFSRRPVRLEVYPANWTAHGKRAGPLRNRQMLETGVDVCLAFIMPGSRGAEDCVRAAMAANVPCIVHRPDSQLN